MSQPAWYPDPSGQPNSFRYWNGQSWSAEITTNPYDPPPASAYGGQAPQQPSQPQAQQGQQWAQQGQQPQPDQWTQQAQAQQFQGQQFQGQGEPAQSWSPMPQPDGSGGSSKKGLWVLLAGVLVILLIAGGGFAVWRTMGDDDDGDTKADDDSSQSSDPSEDPSEDPSADPSEGSSEDPTEDPSEDPSTDPSTGADPLTSCPTVAQSPAKTSPAGRIASGGISAPVADGFKADASADQNASMFEWLKSPKGQYKIIAQTADSGWISLFVVGSVNKSQGYSTPEIAAQSVANCMATSARMYTQPADVTPKDSQQITVDGQDAWRVDQEVAATLKGVDIKGDHAVVVAVETKNSDELAIFAGVVPIGDQKMMKQLDKVVDGITVD